MFKGTTKFCQLAGSPILDFFPNWKNQRDQIPKSQTRSKICRKDGLGLTLLMTAAMRTHHGRLHACSSWPKHAISRDGMQKETRQPAPHLTDTHAEWPPRRTRRRQILKHRRRRSALQSLRLYAMRATWAATFDGGARGIQSTARCSGEQSHHAAMDRCATGHRAAHSLVGRKKRKGRKKK